MGFLEKLKLKDWLGVRQAPTRKAVLYVVDDATGEAVPITAGQLGGGGSGGGEVGTVAKLEEVRVLLSDSNAHAQAANGNTYILAAQAQGSGLKVQTAPSLVALSRTSLVLTAAALPLPAPPAGATAARLSLRGGSASVAVALPAPTAEDGELWTDGSIWELSTAEIDGWRGVKVDGSPVVAVTWLGQA